MKTIIAEADASSLKLCADVLKRGGLAVFPTETVYGLGAAMNNDNAVRKIFEVKGRNEGKPLSILAGCACDVGNLADIDPKILSLIEENFWPGPFTLVAQKKPAVSDVITAGRATVGIRIPADEFALALIKKAGLPLVTTSANISGLPAATSADEAIEALDGKVDIIIKGKKCPVGVASTVAEYKNGALKILREGILSGRILSEKLNIDITE